MKGIVILAAGFGLAIGASATAEKAPESDKPLAQSREDPGEIVCERVKVIGSRLISKKVCMTRLQWREQRTDDRVFTEQVQGTVNLRDGS